ncbi:unnamed protein product [Adineta steineri]|uniref:Ice-binding protein n=2 Tax=Adineta steineri TaxID=433720 RepID=A0A819EZS3_9BILA|nr:unnamed protein product [Adineta steineri]CAF3856717.1 unnamed protein product [Adineta steineri]
MASSMILCVLLCFISAAANPISCPNLNSAANFAVIAYSTVTNADLTIINGNLAISPGIALTGFYPPGKINGTTQLGNGVALQAQGDVCTAYNDLAGATPTVQMTGVDLTGQTLTPGVYKFDSTAAIGIAAGVLTLDGCGVYIFQIGSALSTADNSQIQLINGAKAGCVFWQVGSSVTLGQNSLCQGNILAYASVVFSGGVTLNGSALARTAAVTLISETINPQPICDCC